MEIRIRTATPADLEQIAAIEAVCFPAAEAASPQALERRLKTFPNHFWLLEEDGRIVSFVNGMVTKQADLTDEMYEKESLHCEDGAWQMIFGVDTLPEKRKQGYAGKLLNYVISQAEKQGRKGVVLTCKEQLIPYYEKFGFRKEKLSESVHGGAVWYQMRYSCREA